jgi:hypothetical protein
MGIAAAKIGNGTLHDRLNLCVALINERRIFKKVGLNFNCCKSMLTFIFASVSNTQGEGVGWGELMNTELQSGQVHHWHVIHTESLSNTLYNWQLSF